MEESKGMELIEMEAKEVSENFAQIFVIIAQFVSQFKNCDIASFFCEKSKDLVSAKFCGLQKEEKRVKKRQVGRISVLRELIKGKIQVGGPELNEFFRCKTKLQGKGRQVAGGLTSNNRIGYMTTRDHSHGVEGAKQRKREIGVQRDLSALAINSEGKQKVKQTLDIKQFLGERSQNLAWIEIV